MMVNDKSSFIQDGIKLCESNSFFSTLRLILKYVVSNSSFDGNVMDLVRLITSCELDFKTYVVYTDYGSYLYHSSVKYLFNHGSSSDDVTYFLVHKIKTEYDKDKSVLDPFIEKTKGKGLEISTTYEELKRGPFIDKNTVIFDALELLKKAKNLDYEAFCMREEAIRMLTELKTSKDKLGLVRIENLKFT